MGFPRPFCRGGTGSRCKEERGLQRGMPGKTGAASRAAGEENEARCGRIRVPERASRHGGSMSCRKRTAKQSLNCTHNRHCGLCRSIRMFAVASASPVARHAPLGHGPAPDHAPDRVAARRPRRQNWWRKPSVTATCVPVDDGESVLIIACPSVEPAGAPCTC